MKPMHCPDCGSQRFYVKADDDPFTIFEFDIRDGQIVPDDASNDADMPPMSGATETYCDRCAWHGSFRVLQG